MSVRLDLPDDEEDDPPYLLDAEDEPTLEWFRIQLLWTWDMNT